MSCPPSPMPPDLHHIPSCWSPDSRKELHPLSISLGLGKWESGRARPLMTRDRNPEANAIERSEQSLRSTREGEGTCVEPHVSRLSRLSKRGHPVKITVHHHRRSSESRNNITLILIPLSLKSIQAPATDDVEHANAERSVERLLLEQKGWKV